MIFEDKILYDEVPLSGIIEYRFASDKPWMLGTISQGSLEFYRSSKFKIWKDLLMTGGTVTCRLTAPGPAPDRNRRIHHHRHRRRPLQSPPQTPHARYR